MNRKAVAASILLAGCSAVPQQVAVREFDSIASTISVGADASEAVAQLNKLGYECRDAPGVKQCAKLVAGGFPKCTIGVRVDLTVRNERIAGTQLSSSGKCE